jgi:hypothetical protein
LCLQLLRCGQTGGQLLVYIFKTCSCHTCCQILNKLWNKISLKSFVVYINNYKTRCSISGRIFKFPLSILVLIYYVFNIKSY